MSFRVTLQKNQSPPNFVDKNATDIAYADGELKYGASIIDPVFIIDTELTSDMISQVNYVYVEQLGRYYYVTNIIAYRTSLWEVHCHVDVLMSYKTQIRANDAIICRQEQKYNMMLDDGWFVAFQDPIIKYMRFSDSGGNATTPFENFEYVLVVAGC